MQKEKIKQGIPGTSNVKQVTKYTDMVVKSCRSLGTCIYRHALGTSHGAVGKLSSRRF